MSFYLNFNNWKSSLMTKRGQNHGNQNKTIFDLPVRVQSPQPGRMQAWDNQTRSNCTQAAHYLYSDSRWQTKTTFYFIENKKNIIN